MVTSRSRSLPEPLAEARVGRQSSHSPARTHFVVLICRCPAGAFLAANPRARAAAGGDLRAALLALFARRKAMRVQFLQPAPP